MTEILEVSLVNGYLAHKQHLFSGKAAMAAISTASDSSEMVHVTDLIFPSWTMYTSVATIGATPSARVSSVQVLVSVVTVSPSTGQGVRH